MRKNSYGKILKEEPKKQYLSNVPKSCSYIIILNTLGSIESIAIFFWGFGLNPDFL